MTAARPTFRVEWLPGSDTLQGTCFCGATGTAQDPATMLDWLAAHPVGHEPGGSQDPPTPAGSAGRQPVGRRPVAQQPVVQPEVAGVR